MLNMPPTEAESPGSERERRYAEHLQEQERIKRLIMERYREDLAHYEAGEPLELISGEYPEQYLDRLRRFAEIDKYELDMYAYGVKGFNLLQNEKYSGYFKTCLDYLAAHLDVANPEQKAEADPNASVAEEVSNRFRFTDASPSFSEGRQSFSHTKLDRGFFGTSLGDHRPYAQSLFCLSGDQETDQKYIQGILEGKDICMLGGGDSIQDLMSSGIKPKSFVNIDSHLESESISKGQKSPYVSIPVNAADPDAVNEALETLGTETFDEIWASYSVPMYLSEASEVKGLFSTIRNHLKEGGTARITPLMLRSNWRSDTDSGAKEAFDELVSQIKELEDSPDFNVYLVKGAVGDTLFIRKLPLTKHEN